MIAVAVLLATSGCGGEPQAAVVRPSCEEAWNASGNEAHRQTVAGTGGTAWRVEVSQWAGTPSSVTAPDEGTEGCAFVFFTSTRWLGFSGAWDENGSLRWQPEGDQGARTPGQRQFQATAAVSADGTIR